MDKGILLFALLGVKASIAGLKNRERILEAQLKDLKNTAAGRKPVRLSKNGKRLGGPPKKGE